MIRVAVAVALVAAACGTGASQVQAPPLATATPTSVTAPAADSNTSGSTTTTTATSTTLPPVTVEQVECPVELRQEAVACGAATVPLDRSDADAGTTVITLATVAGYDQGFATPVAVLQGGPGGSSSEMAGWLPQQPFTQIFVDQRGTGFVGPDFDCVELDTAIPDLLAVDSATANAAAQDAYTACARRLAGDPVLATADSDTHAHDVADVMAALGHERWVAYGVSYGSTIGLELMRGEPAGLAGVVLDGVYPPELDVDAGVAYSAARAVAEVDAACASDVVCRSWNDDVSGLLDELIGRLDASPALVELSGSDLGTDGDITVVLDGQRLAEFTFLLLYSESRLRFLPGALAGIAAGETGAAEWFVRTGTQVLISSQRANDEGTYFAVQCRDRLPFTEGMPDELEPFPAAVASARLSESCGPWDREPAPEAAAAPVASDLPALLLSGRFDPITPPDYAADVASRLGSATVVEQDGRGHGIWFGDECIAGIVQQFVADPARELDTSCATSGPEVDWARP